MLRRWTLSKSLRLLITLLVILYAVAMVVPLLWMVIMSTQSTQEIYAGVTFRFGTSLLDNYSAILDVSFFRAFLNSLAVACATVALSLVVSCMCGYAFAMFRFKGKTVLFSLVLATMLVPQEVGLVAYVVQMRFLGVAGTLVPLVLVNLAHAFGVFFITQYMSESIPYEIIESGRVDGCSENGIFFRLVMPMIKGALFTLGVIVFMLSWNSYLFPMVLINRTDKYTIPLAIGVIGSRTLPAYGAKTLAIVIGILPLIIAFLCFSKVITKGLVEGSVKG